MSNRRRRLVEKLRSIYLWHRYAGLVAAMLLIWLAGTGLLLNHADDLGLDRHYVANDMLLSLYHVNAATDVAGVNINGHWISQADRQIYIDRESVDSDVRLIGAASTTFGFVIALPHSLLLYTDDLTLVEKQAFTADAQAINGIASNENGGIYVKAGGQQYVSDANVVSFVPAANPHDVSYATLIPVPRDLAAVLREDQRNHTITWEQALRDLHSGRLFALLGKSVTDVAGLLLLLLAFSGVWIWLQRRSARKRPRIE